MHFTNSTFKKSSAFARRVTFVPGVERNRCSQLFRFSTSQFLKGLIFFKMALGQPALKSTLLLGILSPIKLSASSFYAVKVDWNPWEKAKIILDTCASPALTALKKVTVHIFTTSVSMTHLPWIFLPQVRLVIGSHSPWVYFF